jgi:hypothetical protein
MQKLILEILTVKWVLASEHNQVTIMTMTEKCTCDPKHETKLNSSFLGGYNS